jgi:hypothetical protein
VPAEAAVSESYAEFLERKAQANCGDGFDPGDLPAFLFPFQRDLVDWSLRQGRSAMFADCGLGKTPMQLVWADRVHRRTNGRVLGLTPIAVGAQTVREGEKFGIEVHRSRDGRPRPGITLTNYEQLHKFDPADFDAAFCDESSILKSYDGVLRGEITGFMRKMRYRLLCTATAAPNDYTELGTSSEALGHLGHMDMLARFFKNEQNTCDTGRKWGSQGGGAPKWRFKGHAETPFWRWVCSWARALRRPSDLGFPDDGFILPPLIEREHVVAARKLREGFLFSLPAQGLSEEREERRRTIAERCEKAAELVRHDRPAIVWCHLNPEGDLLESLIPDCVQVSGADSDDEKEEKLIAFQNGEARVLVTKPSIGAWGLNFQHCAHQVIFPSHSFEQYYQSVRRSWRFGQTREVVIDVVATDGESGTVKNLQRKAAAAERMFTSLVAMMGDQLRICRDRNYPNSVEVPSWL